MAGKSCVTQLLEFLEYLTEALDQGKDVDIKTSVKHLTRFHTKDFYKSCIIMVLPVKFISGSKNFIRKKTKGCYLSYPPILSHTLRRSSGHHR